MAIAYLKSGKEARVLQGNPWVFRSDIDRVSGAWEPGDVVSVKSARGRMLGCAFYNPQSQISLRFVTFRDERVNADFIRARIHRAVEYRRLFADMRSCRLVYAESDGLPALIVDSFGGVLSVQCLCLGMEKYKQTIIDALVDELHPDGIYERDDLPVREKEGLPQIKACVYGAVPEELVIREHDADMLVWISYTPATGHFLDQQENRGRLKPYAPGQDVLDLCCCTGGFSIHAALYGAKSVEAVDVSEDALALVRRNAALNGVQDIVTTTCANVFDLARQYVREGRQYGLVVCDPPAFAKSRKALENAYRGYKELNLQCMKLVKPGGYLVSCSCSQFMTPELFLKMLREAAQDAGRDARLLETLIQSRDHPASLASEQSLYLKGDILQIV